MRTHRPYAIHGVLYNTVCPSPFSVPRYVKNKARLTGLTAPGRRFPGHWPTPPWRGSAGRGRGRAPGRRSFFPQILNDPPVTVTAPAPRTRALCSSLRSGHAGEELRCRRWGLHPWRPRQADHARTIAKTRAANISPVLGQKPGGCKEYSQWVGVARLG